MRIGGSEKIKFALADDHQLFRKGLVKLIESLSPQYEVLLEAGNGEELMQKLEDSVVYPDIVLADINMPVMNGFELAMLMQRKYPQIHVLVVTMIADEATLIKMLRLNIKGYLSKDIEPAELNEAIETVIRKGYYYTDYISRQIVNALSANEIPPQNSTTNLMNEREKAFLELACSEYTYKEIADIMSLSVKTVDGYRNALFEKFKVRSRVGLALFAIRNELVKIS